MKRSKIVASCMLGAFLLGNILPSSSLSKIVNATNADENLNDYLENLVSSSLSSVENNTVESSLASTESSGELLETSEDLEIVLETSQIQEVVEIDETIENLNDEKNLASGNIGNFVNTEEISAARYTISETGVLTITSGLIQGVSELWPWNAYRSQIKEVIFELKDSSDSIIFVDGGAGKMFSNMINLEKISTQINGKTITGSVPFTNPNTLEKMFSNCPKLAQMDLSQVDTSGRDIEAYDIKGQKVQSLAGMFEGTTKLKEIFFPKAEQWNTSEVTSMSSMFQGCSSLGNLNLNDWDTSNVETMSDLFAGCTNLSELNIEHWQVTNVRDMTALFSSCNTLTTLSISQWDTSSVVEMGGMFANCTQLTNLNIGQWSVGNVISMLDMFANCSSLTELDLNQWNVSNVTDMSGMFTDCKGLKTVALSNWQVSQVTTMEVMFAGCTNLDELTVTNWDVGNVRDMYGMFESCVSLKKLDVSNWDTRNVVDFSRMFKECSKIEKLEVGKWQTDEILEISDMFAGCVSIKELDFTNWDTSKVVNSTSFLEIGSEGNLMLLTFGSMFKLTSSGRGDLDIDYWMRINHGPSEPIFTTGEYLLEVIGDEEHLAGSYERVNLLDEDKIVVEKQTAETGNAKNLNTEGTASFIIPRQYKSDAYYDVGEDLVVKLQLDNYANSAVTDDIIIEFNNEKRTEGVFISSDNESNSVVIKFSSHVLDEVSKDADTKVEIYYSLPINEEYRTSNEKISEMIKMDGALEISGSFTVDYGLLDDHQYSVESKSYVIPTLLYQFEILPVEINQKPSSIDSEDRKKWLDNISVKGFDFEDIYELKFEDDKKQNVAGSREIELTVMSKAFGLSWKVFDAPIVVIVAPVEYILIPDQVTLSKKGDTVANDELLEILCKITPEYVEANNIFVEIQTEAKVLLYDEKGNEAPVYVYNSENIPISEDGNTVARFDDSNYNYSQSFNMKTSVGAFPTEKKYTGTMTFNMWNQSTPR